MIARVLETFVVNRLTTEALTPNQNQEGIVLIFLVAVFVLLSAGYLLWRYLIQPVMKARREEAKLNAILNSIADGVIVQDLAGTIESMNPSAQKILNSISSDFASQKLDIQTRQAQAEARLTSLLNYLANLRFYETQNFEIKHRVLSARSAPVVTIDGEQLGAVIVLRDITAEVEAQSLKDDFIAMISHELRTPLAVIQGYSDLLRMNSRVIAAEYRASLIKNLEDVDKNIANLLNLIEQMLDLTQLSAGALGINRERVNLSKVVKTEAEHWQASMAEKKLTYQIHLPNEAIWVVGDENRLTRVMYNLIKNAHNYTLPGGRVDVSLEAGPGEVRVTVKDTGVGISDKAQPFIFLRFFRAIHAEHTFDISGAGLGLYLSKAIIEAHGGQIWFESEVNQGSTFSFTLPAAASKSGQIEK